MTKEEKEKLIKYLEDRIKQCGGSSVDNAIKNHVYQDILERIKNNNYE